MELLAVVLPGAGFNVLLGLTCIVKAKVGLDAERQVLLHGGQERNFETKFISEPPDGAICPVFYSL